MKANECMGGAVLIGVSESGFIRMIMGETRAVEFDQLVSSHLTNTQNVQ